MICKNYPDRFIKQAILARMTWYQTVYLYIIFYCYYSVKAEEI